MSTATTFKHIHEAIRYAEGELPVRRGPMLGEHNEEVVREILGRSEEEYISLVMDEILS